jgi:Domain of unknown function (DUF4440)
MDQTLAHTQSSQIIRDLSTLNARFIHNYVTNDVASHDAILHPKFIYISGSGVRVAREPYLKRWANWFDPEETIYWDVRDELITVIGNVALVRSTNKYIERHGETETTGMATYTDAYLCENGAWKCIQAQITPVLPEHWPSDDTIIGIYIKGKRQPI